MGHEQISSTLSKKTNNKITQKKDMRAKGIQKFYKLTKG